MVTGQAQTLVRYGWSDYDTYGSHNYAAAATGNLDAPDLMPQGSTRVLTIGHTRPRPSYGHRDWEQPAAVRKHISHDGPESVLGAGG